MLRTTAIDTGSATTHLYNNRDTVLTDLDSVNELAVKLNTDKVHYTSSPSKFIIYI
jgi:hypothetical protein